jgi:hypothetical protein
MISRFAAGVLASLAVESPQAFRFLFALVRLGFSLRCIDRIAACGGFRTIP